MGLDSYWSKDFAEIKVDDINFDPPLNLVGGMMSGHGQGSFRGKVYDALIETITGHSLYAEFITPEKIKEMASKLESFKGTISPEFQVEPKEYQDLVRMFKAYADTDHGLLGWW